jgi:peptide deformylase
VNPTIVSRSGATSIEEGCLSIPGYREYVDRSQQILVRAFDKKGNPFEIPATELCAVCIQHEIDHLDGVLFVDRISRLKRELFLKWAKKNLTSAPENG